MCGGKLGKGTAARGVSSGRCHPCRRFHPHLHVVKLGDVDLGDAVQLGLQLGRSALELDVDAGHHLHGVRDQVAVQRAVKVVDVLAVDGDHPLLVLLQRLRGPAASSLPEAASGRHVLECRAHGEARGRTSRLSSDACESGRPKGGARHDEVGAGEVCPGFMARAQVVGEEWDIGL
jgi:hypothetical protein